MPSFSATAMASGPLTRTTEIPALPGAVEMAAIVSAGKGRSRPFILLARTAPAADYRLEELFFFEDPRFFPAPLF